MADQLRRAVQTGVRSADRPFEIPGTPGTAKAFAAVDALGRWSRWIPIEKARELAPRQPGVYLARTGRHGPVIYVGMAGERSGRGTTKPQGINGRLSAYLTGQGLGGGLLGRSFDRALRDPVWLRERVADLEGGKTDEREGLGESCACTSRTPLPLAGVQRRRQRA